MAHPGAVSISALTGEGIDDLLRALGDRLRAAADVIELLVPFERGDVLAAMHREGEVITEAQTEGGTKIRARLGPVGVSRFADFTVTA